MREESVGAKMIGMVSDVHFGEHQNNPRFLDMQINWFVNELLPQLNERGIKVLCILGDLFHNKEHTNKLVIQRVYDMFKHDFRNIRVVISLGNHDLYYRDSREVHSLHVFRDLSNVVVVEKIQSVNMGKATYAIVPWLIPSEKETDLATIGAINPDVVLGHFEFSGFSFNRLYPARHGDDAFQFAQSASNVKKWYSGHYHTQSQREINGASFQYLGAPFQYTRIDAGEIKGWWIHNTETLEDEFIPSKAITKFVTVSYPFGGTSEELELIVRGNIVEIEVKTEDFSSKAFGKFIDAVNSLDPYRSEAKLVGVEVNAPSSMKKTSQAKETGEEEAPKTALDLIYEYMDTLNLPEETSLTLQAEMSKLYSEASSSELA
jgi:DNA repair exonuclease SbcCD nuclease subunit